MTISNICSKVGTGMISLSIPGYALGAYMDYTVEKSGNDSLVGFKLMGIFIQALSGSIGVTGLGLKIGSKVAPKVCQKVSKAAHQYWKK